MDFKDWLTLLGVLTGLVGSTAVLFSSAIAFFAYRRDGAIVKIKARQGWQILNAQPPYSSDKFYTSVTVYNRGRRHTVISQVGESFLLKSGGGVYSDSMIYGTRKLDEEGATDFLAEEKPNVKRPKVGYYYANTRAGKSYKYYPNTRIIYWLFWFIRKVDAQKNKRSKKKT